MADGLSQDDIDQLLAAAAEIPAGDQIGDESPASGTGASVAAPAAPPASHRNAVVRTMDFARPSKFNKDQLRTLQMLHESFCRRASTYLSGTVRTLAEISVISAEQVPYGDFVRTHPAPNFNAVLELSPLGTNAMLVGDLQLMLGLIDRMLGGPGGMVMKSRELTDIEIRLASSMLENVLYELTQSWAELVDVAFRLRGVEMNAQFAQVAAPSEPSVVVNFEVTVGNNAGRMALCLPYRAIEDIVGGLTAHRYFAQGEEEALSRDHILDGLSTVLMPVRALVGQVRLPMDTVIGLKPGDVVPLGRKVEEGMTLVVGDTATYRVYPGRDGKRLAVRIDGLDGPVRRAPGTSKTPPASSADSESRAA